MTSSARRGSRRPKHTIAFVTRLSPTVCTVVQTLDARSQEQALGAQLWARHAQSVLLETASATLARTQGSWILEAQRHLTTLDDFLETRAPPKKKPARQDPEDKLASSSTLGAGGRDDADDDDADGGASGRSSDAEEDEDEAASLRSGGPAHGAMEPPRLPSSPVVLQSPAAGKSGLGVSAEASPGLSPSGAASSMGEDVDDALLTGHRLETISGVI